MKLFSAICAAALLTVAGFAEEPPSEFAKAQAELKARAPEEFARIEKLAATDLNAALREFRSVARKHNVKLPRPNFQRNRRPDGEGRRQWRGDRPGRGGNPLEQLTADAAIRKAFPQEFAAVNGELCAAEAKMRDLAKRAGVDYPNSPAAMIRQLRVAAPEKLAEVERLAEDDPRAAFRAFSELMQEQGLGFAPPPDRGRRGFGGRDREEKPEPRRLSNPPLRKLREAFPEEMKRYEELRQEDPAAAKKLLLELSERLKNDNRENRGPRR